MNSQLDLLQFKRAISFTFEWIHQSKYLRLIEITKLQITDLCVWSKLQNHKFTNLQITDLCVSSKLQIYKITNYRSLRLIEITKSQIYKITNLI